MYITIKIYKDIYEDKDIPRDMSGIIKLFIFGMSQLTYWLFILKKYTGMSVFLQILNRDLFFHEMEIISYEFL